MAKQKRSKETARALAALQIVKPDDSMPDWGERIPFKQYLEIDKVSSHSLMDFAKSPRLYKRKRDGLAPRIKSEAFSFGTAVHVYLLEGAEAFQEQYAVGYPINEKTGLEYGPTTNKVKDYKKEMEAIGKTVISNNDFCKICEMYVASQANERIAMILEKGTPEVTIQGSIKVGMEQLQVKQRLDWVADDAECIMDLKTTRSIDTFEEDFWKYQYDIQVGMYGTIMNATIGNVPPFFVVAVEKEEPYASKLYAISEKTMHEARMRVQSLLFRLQGCTMDDNWPYDTEIMGTL